MHPCATENALAHQACVLRSELEKSTRDNASLHSKIARGDKLSAANRSVVNSFQADLASKLDILSSTLTASIDQQNKHLKAVEDLCKSCVDSHDTVSINYAKSACYKTVWCQRLNFVCHLSFGFQGYIRDKEEDFSFKVIVYVTYGSFSKYCAPT